MSINSLHWSTWSKNYLRLHISLNYYASNFIKLGYFTLQSIAAFPNSCTKSNWFFWNILKTSMCVRKSLKSLRINIWNQTISGFLAFSLKATCTYVHMWSLHNYHRSLGDSDYKWVTSIGSICSFQGRKINRSNSTNTKCSQLFLLIILTIHR